MSKAFLRESDYDTLPATAPTATPLPAGAKNLLTAGGAQRLRDELEHLLNVERPPLAARPDDREAETKLQALDQRIRYLRQSLRTAEIVPPPASPDDVVRFGAAVTLEDDDGEVVTYRLVGVDEADPDEGGISYTSPIARALLLARTGDHVRFRSPAGERELEILRVEY